MSNGSRTIAGGGRGARPAPYVIAACLAGGLAVVAGLADIGVGAARQNAPTIRVTLAPAAAREIAALGLDAPVNGRLYVIATGSGASEPREQVDVNGVPFWGIDVAGFAAGSEVMLDGSAAGWSGYPLPTPGALPAGDYHVQALLNVYTTFRRVDGHTVQMHLNSGAGQDVWRAPGNAYSTPRRVTLGPATGEIGLTIDRVIPPIEPLGPDDVLQQGNPPDTELVKYPKIQSDTLSRFWGRPMYIGANVLLPADYGTSPATRYPVIYLQGHFPGREAPFGFATGPDPGDADFTRFWLSDAAPRVIVVTIRDANPYYDTSYSVNSANVGPYGDAIVNELMPLIDRDFRTIDAPWARVLAGGSTGGWEALALQVFHPDLFGGTWTWCPDSVDFRYHQIVDIYSDENAYVTGDWVRVERPNRRRPDGNVLSTIRQENQFEQVVGTRGRSTGQWAIWEAVFGPVAADGYPTPLWDPLTGVIDRGVAAYWREHFDLGAILERRWPTIGSKLAGRIHVAVGDMDSYYLEEAVYLLEAILDDVDSPPADATFQFGRRQPHCWIGASPTDPDREMSSAEFVELAAGYMRARAPESEPAGRAARDNRSGHAGVTP